MANQVIAEKLFALSKLGATQFELDFRYDQIHAWIKSTWPTVPVFAVAIYLAFCYFGQAAMACSCGKDFKKCQALGHPFDLRYLLGMWNFLLSAFSCIGAFRTVPHLLGILLSKSFQESVCDVAVTAYGHGPCGFWTVLFILSKLPELIDTVFIVLRKRTLLFLHWYHHVTVLLFCWHAYATEAASGLYFVTMNYTVHAIMYAYYCAAAFNVVPKGFPAWIITIGQITQMIVGTFVCSASWYYYSQGVTCHNEYNNLVAGALMYGSYLYLFLEFAYHRFLKPKTIKQSKKKD